jgi:hypothetical protein
LSSTAGKVDSDFSARFGIDVMCELWSLTLKTDSGIISYTFMEIEKPKYGWHDLWMISKYENDIMYFPSDIEKQNKGSYYSILWTGQTKNGKTYVRWDKNQWIKLDKIEQ